MRTSLVALISIVGTAIATLAGPPAWNVILHHMEVQAATSEARTLPTLMQDDSKWKIEESSSYMGHRYVSLTSGPIRLMVYRHQDQIVVDAQMPVRDIDET